MSGRFSEGLLLRRLDSFHIPTGKVMQPPCEVPLRTYQVVLKDEDVFADLTHNAAGEAE